jgi:hypothetical protein
LKIKGNFDCSGGSIEAGFGLGLGPLYIQPMININFAALGQSFAAIYGDKNHTFGGMLGRTGELVASAGMAAGSVAPTYLAVRGAVKATKYLSDVVHARSAARQQELDDDLANKQQAEEDARTRLNDLLNNNGSQADIDTAQDALVKAQEEAQQAQEVAHGTSSGIVDGIASRGRQGAAYISGKLADAASAAGSFVSKPFRAAADTDLYKNASEFIKPASDAAKKAAESASEIVGKVSEVAGKYGGIAGAVGLTAAEIAQGAQNKEDIASEDAPLAITGLAQKGLEKAGQYVYRRVGSKLAERAGEKTAEQVAQEAADAAKTANTEAEVANSAADKAVEAAQKAQKAFEAARDGTQAAEEGVEMTEVGADAGVNAGAAGGGAAATASGAAIGTEAGAIAAADAAATATATATAATAAATTASATAASATAATASGGIMAGLATAEGALSATGVGVIAAGVLAIGTAIAGLVIDAKKVWKGIKSFFSGW